MLIRYCFNYLLSVLLLLVITTAKGQNYPVYNNFFINPYLYNPAEALSEYVSIYAVHRQQWLNVEGAPVLSTVSINTMINETRVGIGAKISSYKRGILNNTDFSVSYAYLVPVGKSNSVTFGLSGGAISNSIDVGKASTVDDPALTNYLANNIQPISTFGMLFRSNSGINFGLALPQLFTPSYNSVSSFSNTDVSPFDNIFATFYYKKKVESRIVSKKKGSVHRKVKTKETIAPLELYANYKYSKFGNNQGEVLIKLNLSENFWVGGSFRFPYGYTGNFGLTVNRFIMSYSYEPGTQPENGFSQGTHEVLLGLRLGPQKKFKKPVPLLRSTLKETETKHIARFQETIEDPDKIQQHTDPVKKKYYVIVRVFADFNQADQYKQKLRKEKFNAEVFYYDQDKKYYVHVLETGKAHEAHEEVRNLKTYTKLKDARVLTVIHK